MTSKHAFYLRDARQKNREARCHGIGCGGVLTQLLKKPSQEQIVLLLVLALLIVFSFSLPGFSTVTNLLNLVRSISILGILGLGMGLIVISRGIDLSMISIMAAAWSIPLTQIEAGLSLGAAILLSIFIAVLIGAVNGLIIAFVEAPPLFVTLAASFVIYGLAFWIAPAWVVYAPKNAPALLYPGQGVLLDIPMPIIVFLIAAGAMHLFLSKTSIGRFVYAQGDNPEAARLAGISLRPLIVLEYVILVVVLGGISLIGGRGSVLSVVVGCALIGTLLNAFTIMDVNSEVQNIIRGVVLLAAILLDNWLHPRDEETARQGD